MFAIVAANRSTQRYLPISKVGALFIIGNMIASTIVAITKALNFRHPSISNSSSIFPEVSI